MSKGTKHLGEEIAEWLLVPLWLVVVLGALVVLCR